MEIIQTAEHSLQPTLQKFFIEVIEGKANSSDLRDEYHTLIFQVGWGLASTADLSVSFRD